MVRVQGEMERAIGRMRKSDPRNPEELLKVKMQIESLQSRSKRLRDEIALAEDFQNQLTDSVSKTVKENIVFMLRNRTKEQEQSVLNVVEKVADRLMEEMVNETNSQGDSEEKAMKDAIRRAEEAEKSRNEDANMVDAPLKASGSMETPNDEEDSDDSEAGAAVDEGAAGGSV
jgi:hypothetical protein